MQDLKVSEPCWRIIQPVSSFSLYDPNCLHRIPFDSEENKVMHQTEEYTEGQVRQPFQKLQLPLHKRSEPVHHVDRRGGTATTVLKFVASVHR